METSSIRSPLTSIPSELASALDYERLASQFIPATTHAYIAGGSGEEICLNRNRSAFKSTLLQQRLLTKTDQGSCCLSLLGQQLYHPIFLAPVAHQKLVHPQGELATVAGAEAMDALFISSTLSHTPLEDIAASSNNPKWFQLYFQPSREITLDLVRRAESAGYLALVVTADVPVNGLRYRAQRAGFTMPQELVEANLCHYRYPAPVSLKEGQSIVFDGLMPQAPSWKDLEWLLENTTLPIILKGVTHPQDAQLAQAMGIDGVVVSNHGGRSLDGLPATLELLPCIRQQTGADFPILLDSGIRSGSDIFKALALGADAVLIGRLQVYALAVAGALGVAHMLRTLKTELEVTMALAGCPTLDAITPAAIVTT